MTNVREASLWLSYTYLFVRMLRNPLAYGVGWEELTADPRLEGRRYHTTFLHLKMFDAAQRYQSHKARLSVGNLLLLSFVTAPPGSPLLQHVQLMSNNFRAPCMHASDSMSALLMAFVSCQILPRPLYTAVPPARGFCDFTPCQQNSDTSDCLSSLLLCYTVTGVTVTTVITTVSCCCC